MATTAAPEATTIGAVVNANVRAEMARRNITNVHMAERLNFSTNAFWRRMSGAVAWNLDELEAVAAVLGVEVLDLLT